MTNRRWFLTDEQLREVIEFSKEDQLDVDDVFAILTEHYGDLDVDEVLDDLRGRGDDAG